MENIIGSVTCLYLQNNILFYILFELTIINQAPPSIQGVLLARVLEWGAIAFSAEEPGRLQSMGSLRDGHD